MVDYKPPKGETVWMDCRDKNGNTKAIITSKETREYYYLYEVLPDGSINKLGKAKTPPELEKRFSAYEALKKEREQNVVAKTPDK